MIYGITGFIVGFLLSYFLVIRILRNGEMQINFSDPNKDIYRLCIRNFNKLNTSRYLLVKIEKTDDTQK